MAGAAAGLREVREESDGPPPMLRVLVCPIEPRKADAVRKKVGSELPLDMYGLTRFKRIARDKSDGRLMLLVAPVSRRGEAEKFVAEEDGAGQLEEKDLPARRPTNLAQWESATEIWPQIPPCRRDSSETEVIAEDDIPMHRAYMRLALHQACLGRRHGMAGVGAVVADPVTGRVGPSCFVSPTDRILPMQAVVASHAVAEVGPDMPYQGIDGSGSCVEVTKENCVSCGRASGRNPLRHAAINALDELARLDVARTERKTEWHDARTGESYLCTGMDFYLTEEPCVMCYPSRRGVLL